MQINGSALNTVVINGEVGGNTYTQAISATSSTTSSFLKAAQTAKSVLSSTTASIINALTKTVTAVQSTAVTVLKSSIKLLSVSVNKVVSVAAVVPAPVPHAIYLGSVPEPRIRLVTIALPPFTKSVAIF